RRVGPDGIITTVAGTGDFAYGGDGGPALQAQFDFPVGVALGARGGLYIADNVNHRIRLVEPALGGFALGDMVLASQDGAEVYIVDARGRHLRTQHGLTGALRYQVSYDSAGLLASVTDGDGNVTTIERDARGNATALITPFGQRTALLLDGNG